MLSFDKGDGFVPFVCATDMAVTIDVDDIDIRTVGDGMWKKKDYQALSYTLQIGGVMVFADANCRIWDLLLNQVMALTIPFRISYTDDAATPNVKSMQGIVMIKTSTITAKVGEVSQGTLALTGNGKLSLFDGLIPCPTSIDSITVDGQESSSGIVGVTYSFTGDVYQVKYRIDNTGAWVVSQANATLNIPGLSVNAHTIQIVPICANGFEGTGLSQSFVVTKAQVCSTSISAIVINTPDGSRFSSLSSGVTLNTSAPSMSIQPTVAGAATTYIYSFDGQPYVSLPSTSAIPINNLAPGNHNLGVIPVCTFPDGSQVQGSGMAFSFTLNSQALQSIININYTNDPAGNTLSIYAGTTLVVFYSTSNGSQSINIAVGVVVKAVLSSNTQPLGSRSGTLVVLDDTAGTTLFNQSFASPGTKQYSFTTNGDEFTINGTVSP